MKKHGISRREGNQPKSFSYDELYQMYILKRLSTHEIAKMKGCVHATIVNCLKRRNIELRSRNESLFGRKVKLTDRFLQSCRKNQAKRWEYLKSNPPISANELRELYLVRGLGTRQIAEIKNMTHRRVLSWMKYYGVRSRNFSEAQKIHIKNNADYLKELISRLNHGSRHPNKTEEKLAQFLNMHQYPFRYTGNGSVTIGGMCPDYVATNGSKRIIELFGDYWHKSCEEEQRIIRFREYDYNCLVIWEHELKNENQLLTKISSWLEG